MKSNLKLKLKHCALALSLIPFHAMAQLKTLECDDIIYTVIEKNEKKFVSAQLETIYSNTTIAAELEETQTIGIKAAHYVNEDVAFREILPVKLLAHSSYDYSEGGKVRTNYLLELELHERSRAVSKKTWVTCTEGATR